ncbi:MAG: GNAT family N-acetyltransferase, partial [Bosea sp. (in: a-proteobacteria)]
MSSGLSIRWCEDAAEAPILGAFFAANLTASYISHAELQGRRALGPGIWASDITQILIRDIASRCHKDHVAPKDDEVTRHAVVAEIDGAPVGLALLAFSAQAAVPFGIIEDIVISSKSRGSGHGTALMGWILDAFRQRGLKRAFLESGGGNHDAHGFFERWGFHQTSIVMMAELGNAD